MVKRSAVLAGVDAEAGVPYEETALARRAVRARGRLFALLLLGAGAMLLEAFLARGVAWGFAAAVVALTAAGLRAGRLGALVAAALVSLLSTLLPVRLLVLGLPDDPAAVVVGVLSVAFGLALLPDVVLLIRDAELQHAYGLWARRGRGGA